MIIHNTHTRVVVFIHEYTYNNMSMYIKVYVK